ncbi:bifunctional lysine-specific demethylase and histidyl-hydroxylase NO66 [Trichoplusia ni]|uniref:Bifunctional lysine-specific demethylase and histidyl-hydroxylase n=1 Tax=Trichoplusia ni TaxID=7111 RepID=A0A7E5WU31_TRINI|nr:bifunctional lysine-specific demethylase and histidyl-hydroxylase NO66 [Trichoplusia ni]
MDATLSAFAKYKANTSANKQKKNKKRRKAVDKNTPGLSAVEINDEQSKQIARQLKKKQKKSKDTNITKKKQHKNKSKNKSKTHSSPPASDERQSDEQTASVVTDADIYDAQVSGKEAVLQSVEDIDCDLSFNFEPLLTDSSQEGLKVFSWIIAPYTADQFFKEVWEKKPLHISRKKPNYYKEIITTSIIDDMLRNENIQYTKNIDVTSYQNGEKQTHNPEGRAHPHLVWDFYLQGCSIRLLNPQTYIPKLHLLNATMQEFFNSFVGANAYLTPPDSQGFAPHYDDIEAFILQTEGKKHWRVYKPPSPEEVLARVSSRNFNQAEIGDPILEVILEPGDLLYFPRGYIHQGVTIEGEHSLHLTISMFQKHAWADLFEKLLPGALHSAINENKDLRQGLPVDIYDHLGLVHSDSKTPRRKHIKNTIVKLFNKIIEYLPFDEAVDQMHKEFQHAALPPVLSDLEKMVTVFGETDVMIDGGIVTNRVEMCLSTRIRLLRKNILRMVSEENIRVYYHVENSLEYHGTELPYLEIDEELAPGIESLITAYPEYISVENLHLPLDSDKLFIADALWSRGLVMTEYPLDTVE